MGKLGKKAEIEGGWRVLADTESYWKFEDDKFWWYKSVNDLDDNYWYGSTKIITGLKGVKKTKNYRRSRMDLCMGCM